MPVYQMMDEMPYTELLNWIEFFEYNPPGSEDDMRAYMILSALGVKEKPEKVFPSLAMRHKSKSERNAPDRAMPSGKILDLMSKAKEGDGSEWSFEKLKEDADG